MAGNTGGVLITGSAATGNVIGGSNPVQHNVISHDATVNGGVRSGAARPKAHVGTCDKPLGVGVGCD